MRLFQCSLPQVDTKDWIRDKEEYRTAYADSVKEADKEMAGRRTLLDLLKIMPGEDPYVKITGLILTEKQVFEAYLAGTPVTVDREVAIEDSLEGELVKFRAVVDKLALLPRPERVYNEKVSVHMPGQALSTYNELLLMEDSCSDDLQHKLNDGWRIIAACPQPDQRRPDYIMGRFNPKLETEGNGAARS